MEARGLYVRFSDDNSNNSSARVSSGNVRLLLIRLLLLICVICLVMFQYDIVTIPTQVPFFGGKTPSIGFGWISWFDVPHISSEFLGFQLTWIPGQKTGIQGISDWPWSVGIRS